VVNWYIFPRFGTLYQEKSGNPAQNLISPGIKISLLLSGFLASAVSSSEKTVNFRHDFPENPAANLFHFVVEKSCFSIK
jgi:hypothetical protein